MIKSRTRYLEIQTLIQTTTHQPLALDSDQFKHSLVEKKLIYHKSVFISDIQFKREHSLLSNNLKEMMKGLSIDENMSNLTSASSEKSASSATKNEKASLEPQTKRKRNLPGHPGNNSYQLFFFPFIWLCMFLSQGYIILKSGCLGFRLRNNFFL